MSLIPALNVFVDGPTSIIDAVPVNANFAAIVAAVNGNLDASNFNNNAGFKANGGYVTPSFTNTGAATAATEHIVRGTVTLTISTTGTASVAGIVGFSNAAVFSSSTSYQLFIAAATLTGCAPWSAPTMTFSSQKTPIQFTFTAFGNANNTSTGVLTVDYFAIGN